MSKPTPASKRSLLPVEATVALRADGTPENRRIRFLASSKAVARDGGIVEGWGVADYLRNPVFLWSHNPDTPPIGRAISVGQGERGLEIEVEFAGPEQGHTFADLIWKLYRSKFLNAVSVGFRLVAEREPTEDERKAGARWVGTGELFELSAVAVPADPEAVVLGGRELAGIFTRADVSAAKTQLGAIEPWQPVIRSLEAALVAAPSAPGTTASSTSLSTADGTLQPAWAPEQERSYAGVREDSHNHDLCEELSDLVARVQEILRELHPKDESSRGESNGGRVASQEATRPTSVAGVGETPSAPADDRLLKLLDLFERTYPCQKPQ